MVDKRWKLLPQPTAVADKEDIQNLVEELTISPKLATLLWQRGVSSYDEAKKFFRPQLSQLHDPFLMKDMDLALDRLERAFRNMEKILIYGDYDVDGTTAVALVYGFLSKYYDRLEHYNPDRYKEGYGISKTGIDWAEEQGCSLIIALDCGIKALENIAYAGEKNIDFIVCDHHEPGETLPDAIAVLDPKRKDCAYPFKELTGNGVGFKLLTAFCLKREIPLDELYEFLDLAMISIASDIVPITGENRILAHYGLKKLNTNPRVSLKALKEVAGFQGEMSIESVVFTLGPRINAAGRIKHAQAAVKLLLSENYEEAVDFAYEIQNNNTERKLHDSQITSEALDMIKSNDWLLTKAKSTVLYKEDWHKGVIGIVASRCIEHYYRPTVIFTKTREGFAAGSARSVVGFNLYQAIESCSYLLEQFGGHKHAAGMTILIEKNDDFKEAFDKAVSAEICEDQLVPQIDIDINLKLEDITDKFYRIMKQMGPFGPKNMQPVFMSKKLSLAVEPRILKEKHLKLELLEKETGVIMTALGFNMRDNFYEKLLNSNEFQAVYSLEQNTFRGRSSLQLFLKDLKF